MGKSARPKGATTPATADRRCLWCGKPLPEPTKVASEEYVVPGGLRYVSEYYCPGMRCRELSLARRISQQRPLARPSELAKLQAEKQARGVLSAPAPPFATSIELQNRIQAVQGWLEKELHDKCTAFKSSLREHGWWRSVERDSHSDDDRRLYEKLVAEFLAGLHEVFEAALGNLMERARESSSADGDAVAKWAEERIPWCLDQRCDPADLAQVLDDGGLVVLDQVPEWLESDCNVRTVATKLRSMIDAALHQIAAKVLMRVPIPKLKGEYRERIKTLSANSGGAQAEPKHTENSQETAPTLRTTQISTKLPPKKHDLSNLFDSAGLTERQRDCASLRWEYELPVAEIGISRRQR